MLKYPLLLLLLLFVQIVHASEQPNILIITVDDMSADSIGVFGCPIDTTPHIDQLASKGLRFEHAHVQVGNCMPSRNVMWSGRYSHNNGVEGFYQVKQPEYPVLCDLMKEAGYFTGIRGKVSHSTPYSPYDWDEVLDTDANGNAHALKDPVSYGASTRDGIKHAQEQKKPFCLVINISDPHKPFYGVGKGGREFKDPFVPSRIFSVDEVPIPKFLFDDPIVRQELVQYYSSVRRADDCVGEVLKALEESGAEEKTLIMFLSDHGMPLPFAKTQLYHHSTRTPLIFVWPGKIEANSHDREHMVSAVDFLPTLLDVVRFKHPEDLDGRSFEPLLMGDSQENRDYVFKEYNENAGASRDPMRGVESRQYLYLFNPWSNGDRVMATATTGTMTYRRMKVLAAENSFLKERHDLYQHRVPEELYDVVNDPECLHNLIDIPEFQDTLHELEAQLQNWLKQTNDPLLEVFVKREDDQFREEYVQKVEQEALERRNGKRQRGEREAKPQSKKQELISIQTRQQSSLNEPLSVNIQYQLSESLGKQKLHVTLKSENNLRIERQVLEITGTGTKLVNFKIPEDYQGKAVRVAAFVGEDFEQSLQHLNSDLIKLQD